MATPLADRADRHRLLRWLASREVNPASAAVQTVTAREAHALWGCTSRARWNRTLNHLAVAGLVWRVDPQYVPVAARVSWAGQTLYALTGAGRKVAARLERDAAEAS